MKIKNSHWSNSLESFIEYYIKITTRELKKNNPELINMRAIMTLDEGLFLYNNDKKFKDLIDQKRTERTEILIQKVTKLGKRAHQIHGKDLLERSIHSSESQSKSGKKGGLKNVETGWVYVALELARDAQKKLLESDTPEGEAYRQTLSNNGTIQMQKINTMKATCEVCGETHQIGVIKQYHTVTAFSDMCGKPRKKTKKMIESWANKDANLKRTKKLKDRVEKEKQAFIERQNIMFNNISDVFTRKEFDALGKTLGIKTNYNYLKNTKYYEKLGFGKYRKIGSNATLKTEKEKQVDLIYNRIKSNINFTKREALEYCKDLNNVNIKTIGYIFNSRTDLFKLVVKGNCQPSVYTKI